MRTDASTFVFVYGTLKRGFCRASALANQQFLGDAQTVPKYRLVNCGDYPGLLASEPGKSIRGELYAVDVYCLQRLDDIEAVNEDLYRRGPIELESPYHQTPVVAYFYNQDTTNMPECGTSWE
ncbi:gamma-glutamylcyclotransferase family protein [Thalassoroseus pseudoceratinae]|uniref:gamma-glutamylcyclotransferase family protein n=1 Tax=Thalassoroseus pseudoceratinae TaxID=2713176 RepID=UPI001422C4EF|nr:gamma-glutamylcyclotransferase family protein [Thalassoroseus pseudoceratinae]